MQVNTNSQVDDQFNRSEIERLKQLLEALKAAAKGVHQNIYSKVLWDDNDLKQIFNISQSTIERRRKDETFKYEKIGSRYYYKPHEIIDLRKGYIK